MKINKKKIGKTPDFVPLNFVKAGEIKSDDEDQGTSETLQERDFISLNMVDRDENVLQQLEVDEESSDSVITLSKKKPRKPKMRRKKFQVSPKSERHSLYITFRGKADIDQIKELNPNIAYVFIPRAARYCFAYFDSEEALKLAYNDLQKKKLNGRWLSVKFRSRAKKGTFKL